jgi:long-chain acyl-CoA synthetase
MDLTKLLDQIPGRNHVNGIFTFEQDRVVRRTHADFYADVKVAAANLRKWGVKPTMRVGIRAPNCYAWMVYDLALIEVRAVCVAFTEDFANTRPEVLTRKYDLSLLLLGGDDRGRYPDAGSSVAYLTGENTEVQAVARESGGSDAEFAHPWLIFSSGSSGGLKALALNREGVEDWVDSFAERAEPRAGDRILLFLPMSNFQQRPMCYAALWYGIDLILVSPVRVFAAMKQLRPTILIAPPTLYEMFESRFSSLPEKKRWLALKLGWLVGIVPSQMVRQWMARLIFRQAYDTLGGHMRIMVTGMAPIKRSTLELFALMQLPLFETYGLVECGSITLNAPGACRVGSVGRPLRGVELSLEDDGEIVVHRHNAVATTYFECAPGENEKTFLGDNRVATGDIGRFDEDGYLYLIGRKKEIIITPGGEKVHPEVVEGQISSSPDVARAVVFAPEGENALTAVILLNKPGDNEAEGRVRDFVDGWNEQGPLIEIGNLVFTDTVFSRENGFLRPNLKLDRRRIQEHFERQTVPAGLSANRPGGNDER